MTITKESVRKHTPSKSDDDNSRRGSSLPAVPVVQQVKEEAAPEEEQAIGYLAGEQSKDFSAGSEGGDISAFEPVQKKEDKSISLPAVGPFSADQNKSGGSSDNIPAQQSQVSDPGSFSSSQGVVQGVFGSEEYQERWQPGMAALGAAKASAETGWEGAKGAGELGLAGAKGAGELGLAGAKGAGELGLAGAKGAGELGLAGAKGSMGLGVKGAGAAMDAAGAGIDKSLGLAGEGIEGSMNLAGKGISASGELAEAGASASAKLGLSGIKKSGKLAKAGAEGSLSLAKSGISASADVAAAPARWAKKRMAGTKSRLKKAGYAMLGGLGTLVSAPAGLVGAVGSGALGAVGAVGSGALGAAGAIGSGALGTAGVIGSGALGAAGAIGSGALGAAGAIGSGALGATGAVGSAALGVGGAATSLALGATGAVGAGALGATGAIGAGALGATGAIGAGALGATGAIGAGALGATGAIGAGALGLTGAALAGTAGGLAMAGGGIAKGGKMIKEEAGSTLNKGLLGKYDAGVSHPEFGDKYVENGVIPSKAPGEFDDDGKRKSYGETTAREGLTYGLQGAGGAASVGASITDMASKGNVIGASIRDNAFASPIAGGAEAFGGLGAAGGILGAGASLVDSVHAGKQAADKSGNTSTRVMAGAQSASSLSDATKSSATAAFNIASLVDAKGAAAAGAQIAAGGAAIATGAIDMLRGGYGAFTAVEREKLLLAIKNAPDASDDVKKAADEAIATQGRAKTTAGSQILKGALAVAGGILLATSMATPVGWMLLGIGAVVGIAAAIKNWWDKRSQKKMVAARELGVADRMKDRETKIAKIKDLPGHGPLTKKRKNAIAALGHPLKEALAQYGFSSVGHFYSNYINATANQIFTDGVVNDQPEYASIISSIGLKIDKKGANQKDWKPTPEKIAKALSG